MAFDAAYPLTFYPDKPHDQSPTYLGEWDEEGVWICQQKVDGWRMIIFYLEDGRIEIASRHNKLFTGEIQQELRNILQTLDIPPGSQIDSEWLSRRSCQEEYSLAPQLVLFDVIQWGGKWLINTPYEERLAYLQNLEIPNEINPKAPSVSLTQMAPAGGFVEFWDAQPNCGWSEGVVVKRKNSVLVADRNGSKKNPVWFKIKFRGGSDGDLKLGTYRTSDISDLLARLKGDQ